MSTIHALLIGINEYPNPRHALKGCLNDLEDFRLYLEASVEIERYGFRPLTLVNEQATRNEIIQGFSHFDAAKNGDICIFFFAGHGSRCAAPEAFWHIEPDRMHESLVCWDSRLDGGKDLLDKEMSFLIWKSSLNKEVHFVVIMDCCHSGTNSRGESEVILGMPQYVRNVETVLEVQTLNSYLGYETYKKVGENSYSPPRARHVHLAAAKANETAKEVFSKGKYRGIFTYSLLDALVQAGNCISYSELVSRINIRMKNAVHDQTAQLYATITFDKNLDFLTGVPFPEEPYYLVGFKSKLGWILNAGALHGLTKGDAASKTQLELITNGKQIEVVEVFVDYSRVIGMEGYDKKKSYKVKVINQVSPKLKITIFNEEKSEESEMIVRQIVEEWNHDLISFEENILDARYVIHVEKESLSLTTLYNRKFLLQSKKIHSKNEIIQFLDHLGKFSNWVQAVELLNPSDKIREEEIKIELFQVTEAGNIEDNAPVKLIDWKKPDIIFYSYLQGNLYQPAIQLRIKNTGDRILWVSAIYLGADYSISNQLLPKQELATGEEIWAIDVYEGYPYRTIPIELPDYFHSKGITIVEEYLKIFISSEEMNTDIFNQTGIDSGELGGANRGNDQQNQSDQPRWSCKTIPIRIHKPVEFQKLSNKRHVVLGGLYIYAPKGFMAKVLVNSLMVSTRNFLNTPYIEIEPRLSLLPFELGLPISQPSLCVLELFEVKGEEKISSRTPLKLKMKKSKRSMLPTIKAFACNSKTGEWISLKYEIEGNSMLIHEIPVSSPSSYNGLGDSVKIFFYYEKKV